MAMHTWFECKIRYEKMMENGMIQKVTEPYLVDALSFTEAEARIIEEVTPFITGEFTVSDIKRANYSELFVSDEEVSKVVEFLKEENNAEDSYGADIQEKIQTAAVKAATSQERDEYFEKAAEFIIDKDKASIASLQRVFKIGFNRAARLMDQLCEAGIVGEEEGTKPRKVLMSEEQFEQYKEDYL
jgi:predicted HTH transcriptional regulator